MARASQTRPEFCQLGKVVKSTSHCDYVVQVDTTADVACPPQTDDYGFGQFVSFEDGQRHWAVGIIYDSQLFNAAFLNSGPRLTSAPDPIFTPDLIQETAILLNIVLVGTLQTSASDSYGLQGIPRVVIPANTPVRQLSIDEVHRFHRTAEGEPQFCYYAHLLSAGGSFSTQLAQQVLGELIGGELFSGPEQKALQLLRKELSWKSTLGALR